MARGRRPLVDPPVRKRINIPESVANQIDVLLADPLTGDVAYSAWSNYITKLINDDLKKAGQSVVVSLAKANLQ